MKDFLEKLKQSKIFSFISRNLTLLAFIAICLLLLVPSVAELRVIYLVCIFTGLAIFLSQITLYAYTHYKATKALFEGNDESYDLTERITAIAFAALIFFGICILEGLIVVGVYIAQKGF